MDVDARSLADLATSLWRMRRNIADHPHKRHVRAVFDAMKVFGLEARSYDGDPFDSKLRLRILDTRPSADLEREQILETVRPAVYLRGILVQTGEIILGTPQPEPPAPPTLEDRKRVSR